MILGLIPEELFGGIQEGVFDWIPEWVEYSIPEVIFGWIQEGALG